MVHDAGGRIFHPERDKVVLGFGVLPGSEQGARELEAVGRFVPGIQQCVPVVADCFTVPLLGHLLLGGLEMQPSAILPFVLERPGVEPGQGEDPDHYAKHDA